MKDSYEDIIDLPHPTSEKHERMSRMNRAAQFAPFSALTGLGRALKQTADKNEEKWEMEYGEEDETDIMDDPAGCFGGKMHFGDASCCVKDYSATADSAKSR